MKSITAKWFECAVRVERTSEKGITREVTEKYVVDALSFTEAETRIVDIVSEFSPVPEVRAITIQPYGEVFFSDNADDDKYFKVKIAVITLDEKSGKMKKQPVTYLVQARTPDGAIKYTEEMYASTCIDYLVVSSAETTVLDVFLHK